MTGAVSAELAVEVIEASATGDRSYLVSDGTVGVVIDPPRDIDRVLTALGRTGTEIVLVLDTHLHHARLSGGLELSRLTGADYGLAAEEEVLFTHRPLRDGDVVGVSERMQLRVVAAAGHTFHHLAFVLEGNTGAVGAFTGASVLEGTTGRTDLMGPQHIERMTRSQHRSAHRIAEFLLPDGRIWPTPAPHGLSALAPGVACPGEATTLGDQRTFNPVFTRTEDEFLVHTGQWLTPCPSYHTRLSTQNHFGPAPLDLRLPPLLSGAELAELLRESDEWVIDTRNRVEFLAEHLAGSINAGLDGPMGPMVVWLTERHTPLTLLCATIKDLRLAQRELRGLGVDRLAAAAIGDPADLAADPNQLTTTRRASFTDLGNALHEHPARRSTMDAVVDLRPDHEWYAWHVDGAVHVPLPELPDRIEDIPPGTVWVHCSNGYHASLAASLLARTGRAVVVVDDTFDALTTAGIPLISEH